MTIRMKATKLIVGDLDKSKGFYEALGMKVLSHNLGGEDEFRQEQFWLSQDEGGDHHILILSHFVNLPPPLQPGYPGELWLAFEVPDVDATIETVENFGGQTLRAGQDRPEHGVRAAVVSDPEGHFIEIVGPMSIT